MSGSVGGVAALLRIEPRMLVYVSSVRGQGALAVAGAERATVDQVVASLVAVAARRRGGPGRASRSRSGRCAERHDAQSAAARSPRPRGGRFAVNYAAATRAGLDELMRAPASRDPGGSCSGTAMPGTGKSFALRALAREWRAWCDVHFISDPDAYLGSRTSYLMSTLLRPDGGAWRLIVLEDAGELLSADARALTGQAVSRLLNVTDGLLGEGLRALVLVTTNEPLRRLHEAVARPGRCWAQIEFRALAAADADAWLHARGRPAAGREATLAELYAHADRRIVPERRAIGFGPAAA